MQSIQRILRYVTAPCCRRFSSINSMLCYLLATFATVSVVSGLQADQPSDSDTADSREFVSQFNARIKPILSEHCFHCHDVDNMESGIRVDNLTGELEDRQLFLWKAIAKQVSDGAMPPEDEAQPSAEQRKQLTDWIDDLLTTAKRRKRPKNGSVRRLTVSQYRNTLRDLLGIEDDLTEVLPRDGVSKDGFLNNGQTLQLSPLLVEAYFDIAQRALDLCIVDPKSKPTIQNFRMDFGRSINRQPCPDNLILGANSHLLRNEDFVVTELEPQKPFAYEPFRFRKKYRYIEGYNGNATVRGWRNFDSLYHAVFACMRGTGGYPKGQAYEVLPDGLVLRPAIPSSELFGQSSTYGPKANFKISLRELPDQGNFRVTVTAAKYLDGLLLDRNAALAIPDETQAVTADFSTSSEANLDFEAGIYQVDAYYQFGKKNNLFSLTIDDRHFASELRPSKTSSPEDRDKGIRSAAFMLVRLPSDTLRLTAKHESGQKIHRVVFTKLDETSDEAKRFLKFEKRVVNVGVHVGLRRDCGSTLTQVGSPQPVASGELRKYVFEAAISNFPSPDVEKDNVNYLAGVREIGVRSEYTDGRDLPRLLIQSIEFEGPLFETWPPQSHRRIFVDSKYKNDESEAYAREIIRSFATRAFRRPITEDEEESFVAVWEESFRASRNFTHSIKDALLVALTSPQFVFLIENSKGPESEPLSEFELASKVSYFLWNTAPDTRLLKLAQAKQLSTSIDSEIDRMIDDDRFEQFISEFASQWLSLEKLDVLEVDRKRFPKLTRDTKQHLRNEPVNYLKHVARHNLPLKTLVESDFILANDVVASYYDLGDRVENGFEFSSVKHENPNLGGLLTQAGILAGLSDGREANPVKRGAWLARKLIAEPPDDPPPNVPALPEGDDADLTLREKLEKHRNQKGCVKCHAGIDPWGLPLEQFDAGGRFIISHDVSSRSTLPDKTEVQDAQALRSYLANDRLDQVAFSFLKHLAIYGTGRSLSYNEIEFLKAKGLQLKPDGYRVRELIHFVVKSEIFLEK